MIRKLSLIEKILKRFGIRFTLISSMVLITTLACAFVIINNYIDQKDHFKILNQEIEHRLTTSTYLAIEYLGRDYHDKIAGKNTLTANQYDKIVDHFNKLCVKLDLEYLWSLMLYEGKIVFTSSTSPSKDVSKQDHAKFFDVHTNPELYESAFKTMNPVFQTNIDKWGSIKVVLVPFLDNHDRKYLFGASIKIIDYKAVLYTGVRNQVLISLLFVIATFLLSLFIAGRISEPVLEKVRESEFQYQTTLESMDDVIHVMDSDFNLVLANQALRKQTIGLGIQGDLIGRNLFELFPFLPENINKELRQVFDTGKLLVTEEKITIQGEDRYTETRKIPILSSNRVNQIVTVIRDITERKQAEEQLKASLKEKNTLIDEIHHRVKNNMNIISSLLKLQSNNVEDDRTKSILKDSQNRIFAMSAIHETIHGSEKLSEINLKSYISKITTSVFQSSLIDPKKVKLNTDIGEIPISINQASPIGLIINELISNSLKYAFSDERKGEINVSMKKQKKELELTVMDDGVGMPKDLDWKNSSTLGLKLVRTLVENQLDGSIDMQNKNGTKFTIKFNIET